jgi:hypothetical protein
VVLLALAVSVDDCGELLNLGLVVLADFYLGRVNLVLTLEEFFALFEVLQLLFTQLFVCQLYPLVLFVYFHRLLETLVGFLSILVHVKQIGSFDV